MQSISAILANVVNDWDRVATKLWVIRPDNGPESYLEVDAGSLAPILNSLSDGLIIIDLEGQYRVFNKAAINLLGISGSETVNQIALCGFFQADKITPFEPSQKPLQRALRGEEVDYVEAFIKTPAQPKGIHIEIGARAIRDENGVIQGAVGLVRNISERKIAEEKLANYKRRLETFLHMVSDNVWEWDLKRNVAWRPAKRHAFGHAEEEIQSADRWWKEKVHPDDRPRIFGLHEQILRGEIPSYKSEFRYRKADGSYAYVIGQTHVVHRDDQQVPTYLMGATIDISERRAFEEKMASLACLVESTDDAFISTDLNRRILSWNRGAEKLLGYRAEEVVGQSISVLGEYPDDAEVHQLVDAKVLKGESIPKMELWRKRKDGKLILMSLTLSPMRNQNGQIMGTCAVFRDITDRRKAEDEVKQLAENLTKSNTELQQFAYVASHDLREPLRTMGSFASLLKKDYADRLDSRGQEYINFILDGSIRLRHLTDSLLAYSKVEESPLGREPVDCNQMIRQLQNDLSLQLFESGTQMRVSELPVVEADPVQFYQLFQNLISNAIKFCGERAARISVSAKPDRNNQWLFSVKDEGIGIDPNFRDRVFKLFQRLHGRGEYPGARIGLATCKKIVERHGGRIWFESEMGRGTTFYFTLSAA